MQPIFGLFHGTMITNSHHCYLLILQRQVKKWRPFSFLPGENNVNLKYIRGPGVSDPSSDELGM